MFKDIKGGHVMLKVGGKCKTVNIAILGGLELGLYAKVHGNWYSQLLNNGRTMGDHGWSHLHIPASHNRIDDSPTGRIQVECVATKVAKRLGVEK